MGRSGSMRTGDVYRFDMPRTDLEVTVDGVPIEPALALGSWVSFLADDEATTVMEDLVLLEDEVQPVIARLLEGGVVQTALHNHLIDEEPSLFFLHFWAVGEPAAIARRLRSAVNSTGARATTQ